MSDIKGLASEDTVNGSAGSKNTATPQAQEDLSMPMMNESWFGKPVEEVDPLITNIKSNCDAETSHILRHHYQRPYFLPETAESTHADWIFMGTPGHGAHMHIDHVINPSWQGQIKGFKRWFLQPPPECMYECQSFHVDVHPGDIIVLDTNKWYHQTEILAGENSITIGSEYD